MNDQGVQQLKSRVHARISVLKNMLNGNDSISNNKKQQAGDKAASLDLTISSTVEAKLMDSARAEIRRLERNLIWLDSEDAGFCDDCGCEIPLARLMAVPETRLCVACAERN